MLDVNGTRDVTIAGGVFRLSAVPMGVVLMGAARERAAVGELELASRVEDGRRVPVADTAEARRAFDAAMHGLVESTAANRLELLQWGLRSYATDGGGEQRDFDGKAWVVLSRERVGVILSWGAEIGAALVEEITKANVLTAKDVLGFLRPSGS